MEPVARLSGRCACGVIREWATGEEHLACEGKKRCRVCRAVRSESKFRRQRGRATPTCKVCAHEYQRKWQAANLERRRQSAKEYHARKRAEPGFNEAVAAKKRRRYRTDPAFREALLRTQKQRRANRGVRAGREAA